MTTKHLGGLALLIACACGTAPGTNTDSLSAQLVLDPASNNTFAYLRSNVTGWDADAATAMERTTPGEYEKTFVVNQQWMVDNGLPLSITLTNQENGWGSTNESVTDPDAISTPNSTINQPASLVEGHSSFYFKVPAQGEYTISIDLDNLTYVVSDGSGPAVMPGDVNGDGSLTAVDFGWVGLYLAGNAPTGFIQAAADVNCDGQITKYDEIRLTWAVVGAVSVTTCPQTAAPPGDVNGDGDIDIVDALAVAQYVEGMDPSPFDVGSADADCDGVVSADDAARIAEVSQTGEALYCPLGDVDGDGDVNAVNNQLLELHLAGNTEEPFSPLGADTSCDGQVDELDLELLKMSQSLGARLTCGGSTRTRPRCG